MGTENNTGFFHFVISPGSLSLGQPDPILSWRSHSDLCVRQRNPQPLGHYRPLNSSCYSFQVIPANRRLCKLS